jgi:hypothetical protein
MCIYNEDMLTIVSQHSMFFTYQQISPIYPQSYPQQTFCFFTRIKGEISWGGLVGCLLFLIDYYKYYLFIIRL